MRASGYRGHGFFRDILGLGFRAIWGLIKCYNYTGFRGGFRVHFFWVFGLKESEEDLISLSMRPQSTAWESRFRV